MKGRDAYVEQIRQMALKARAWVARNPQAKPKVQFNFPETMGVIAPISVAIERHYIVVDTDGKALIVAMCKGLTEEREPTPTMVRIALKIIDAPDLDTPLPPKRSGKTGEGKSRR